LKRKRALLSSNLFVGRTPTTDQDLRERSFPVASVTQGLMAKAPVIVWHIAQFRYRVMVRSSFALHVWKALVDAAEEWV
jgi:sarcosine oxidase, subunit gamma